MTSLLTPLEIEARNTKYCKSDAPLVLWSDSIIPCTLSPSRHSRLPRQNQHDLQLEFFHPPETTQIQCLFSVSSRAQNGPAKLWFTSRQSEIHREVEEEYVKIPLTGMSFVYLLKAF